MKSFIRFLIITVVLLSVSAAIAYAGHANGVLFQGLPLMLICAALAYLVQWVVFVPSYIAQTEKYYDLTGSLTYISVIVMAYLLSGKTDLRSLILTILVVVWALRLGSFLFRRILQDGKDSRFDEIKPNKWRFIVAWTIQGAWVFITTSCALAAITGSPSAPMTILSWVGVGVWLVGFAIEAVADHQKSAFKKAPENADKFIQQGLWKISRHPNYFGEIMLWIGICLIAAPVLSGWQWVTLISPIFVTLLLTRVSGIPMLEAKSDKRWGEDPDYQAYKQSTPVLIPFIGGR